MQRSNKSSGIVTKRMEQKKCKLSIAKLSQTQIILSELVLYTVKRATHPHNWNSAERLLNDLNLVNKRFSNTGLDLKLHIAQKAKKIW